MKKLRSKVCKSVLALALFLTMASQAVLVNAKTADVVFVLDGSGSMGEYGKSNDIDDGSGNKLYRLQAMMMQQIKLLVSL